MRLVRIKQLPDPDEMEVDGGDPDVDYPPTFNLQNELVRLTVSLIRVLCSVVD